MSGGGFRSFQPNRARLSVSFFQGGEILMKGEGGAIGDALWRQAHIRCGLSRARVYGGCP
ncbi:hypothetical protein HMPREF0762_01417 [Slackia exigua ATCC 700122]|uniref:Uncharacterized protein n=1 Tax=Slackia exigua (strain ATCC 700122 / DSM 15923 / CIP 105133 / JCM 11022 / KCTC 5966 / S-7) TaxID=649764 RepID=D0WHU8_SLAES|nr:hypothetical protein HMPREF0762_01417 [Slackia exigua ATCC 700122]